MMKTKLLRNCVTALLGALLLSPPAQSDMLTTRENCARLNALQGESKCHVMTMDLGGQAVNVLTIVLADWRAAMYDIGLLSEIADDYCDQRLNRLVQFIAVGEAEQKLFDCVTRQLSEAYVVPPEDLAKFREFLVGR